jgi:hypothetical protein
MICYLCAVTLYLLQSIISATSTVEVLSCSLKVILDYMWSLPSLISGSFVLAFLLWLSYQRRKKREDSYYRKWMDPLFHIFRFCLIFFVFVYCLFPLGWAKRSFSRSLQSFPDYTVFTFSLTLLSLAGTIFFCFYCFNKLPRKAVLLAESITSSFFKIKESILVGTSLVICMVVTGIIAYTVLDHIPHVEDSIAQLFQAKIFKAGKLYAPLPPHKEFFDYTNIINDTKWYSQYPPGHSLLLMVGLFFGVPWLIGPLVGTLSLFLLFLVVRKIYDDHRIHYLCCGLLLFSPFFLFMSSNHMNHSSTLFFLLLFLYFYLYMFSSNSNLYALFCGLSLGYAINIRPLDGVAVAIPFVFYALYCVYKKREVHVSQIVCFCIGVFLMVCTLLLYNKLTTGNPFIFGYQQKFQSLGFLGGAQFGPPHTAEGGIINTSNNLIGLNQHLFEWPLPSLVFIFIFFFIPAKRSRWDYLFLISSLTLIVSYSFYFYQDLCFGPRNFYSLLPFAVILTVRGFLELPKWLEAKGFERLKTEATLYFLLLVCLFYTTSFSIPSLIKKYSDDYWWITDKIHKEVRRKGITNALVFIDVWHPSHITEPNLIPYGSGFQFNSPDLDDEVIYAIDLRERNRILMNAFPERSYYLCKIHKPMKDFSLLKLRKQETGLDPHS